MKSLFFKYISVSTIFLFLVIIAGCSPKEDAGKIPITTMSEEAKADFLKGRDLNEKLKVQESLQYFENAFAKDNSFALSYYYHALANPTAKGFFEDLANAVKYAENASEGEKLIIMSLQAGSNGDTKMQEEYLTKLVNQYPNDERAHSLIGTFYFGQQMYDKSITHLQKSTELAPDYSASFNMIGYAYKNMGNYSDAETAFQRYIELIPNDPNPYDSYAELLLKEGKYEESIEQYRKALSIDPDFVASFSGISTNYNFLSKYEDARKELQTFYDKGRNDGEKRTALFGMAVSYSDEGNYDKALEQIQKEYEIAKNINDHGNMTADLNVMGNILYEAGKFDDAMKKYDESLQVTLSSDLSDEIKENTKILALYNSGRVLLMKNKLADAKMKAKEFSERANASNNTFQIWLSHELEGLIALKEKDFKKAENEFNMANLQNPYTFYYLGLAYEGSKNNEMAKNNFEKASNFNALSSLNQSFVRNKIRMMNKMM